jgi:hypothetical protein
MGETRSVTEGAARLPRLDDGVVRLATDDDLRGPLHALVCDHLLGADGDALWVDAGGHATTGPLARVAPSERFLDRVSVARGFTAHQHAALLDRLAALAGERTALVVCPAIDLPYREGETDRGPRPFLERAADRLAGVAETADCPVVVSAVDPDGPAAPVRAAADRELRYEATRFGPRFVGENFETLAYRTGGYDAGGAVQTTLAFWARLLERRREALGGAGAGSVADPAGGTREVSAGGAH